MSVTLTTTDNFTEKNSTTLLTSNPNENIDIGPTPLHHSLLYAFDEKTDETTNSNNTTSINNNIVVDLFMRGDPILVDLVLHHDNEICLQDAIEEDHNEQSTKTDKSDTITTTTTTNENQKEENKTITTTATPTTTPTSSATTNNDTTASSSSSGCKSPPLLKIQVNYNNNNNNQQQELEENNTIIDQGGNFLEDTQHAPSITNMDDSSPVNSEFSSAISVISYGSSLPSTPNANINVNQMFTNTHNFSTNSSSSSLTSLRHTTTDDDTDWEIIVKNRNAQQVARMASASGLSFCFHYSNQPQPQHPPSHSLPVSSLSSSKLDTSSLNENSFRKKGGNQIIRHSSDQRILSNGTDQTIMTTSGTKPRKSSFLWGRSSTERKNSFETKVVKERKNSKLDISATSIESSSSLSLIDGGKEESFLDFLESVDCRMNVVSIDSLEEASNQVKKETLKKSKFWDRLKIIKQTIKKQLVEEQKTTSNSSTASSNTRHSRSSSNTNLTADVSDTKSTTSSSGISDDEKYTVLITKPSMSNMSSAEDEMRYCLSDPICMQLFDEFCYQECSQENLLLWKELNKVKTNFKKLSDKRRSKTLRSIHSKFFTENSNPDTFDVNVSGKTKVKIEEQANSKRVSLVSGANVLNSLQRDCINNLCDSFSRFILTEDYKLWKQNFGDRNG